MIASGFPTAATRRRDSDELVGLLAHHAARSKSSRMRSSRRGSRSSSIAAARSSSPMRDFFFFRLQRLLDLLRPAAPPACKQHMAQIVVDHVFLHAQLCRGLLDEHGALRAASRSSVSHVESASPRAFWPDTSRLTCSCSSLMFFPRRAHDSGGRPGGSRSPRHRSRRAHR